MPIPSEADDALYVALMQVCDRSFYTLVESCDPSRFAALVKSASSDAALEDAKDGEATLSRLDWLNASVAFDGTFLSGQLEIFLPARLARWLVASMLGVALHVDDGDVVDEYHAFDGIGEFANIVCGSWLTELGRNQAFNLRTPTVARVSAGWNPLAEVTTKERRQLVCINDLPMRLVVRPAAD